MKNLQQTNFTIVEENVRLSQKKELENLDKDLENFKMEKQKIYSKRIFVSRRAKK